MNKSRKIIFIIAVIGTIACLVSSSISLLKADNLISGITFGLAGLFCLPTTFPMFKKK